MRAIAFALALALTIPAAALAGGINFAWNACLPEGGSDRATFACSSNQGSTVAVGSFVLSAPQPSFVGRLNSPLQQQVIAWQCGNPWYGAHLPFACTGSEECPTLAQPTSWGSIKSPYR